MIVNSRLLGRIEQGDVFEYILANNNGLKVRLINIGATITHLWVPGQEGKKADVVLGYDDWRDYLANPAYMGCTVGRYANRIEGGQFILDGQVFSLSKNDGPNSLHGGTKGLNKKVWQVSDKSEANLPRLEFTTFSPDGEEGYPGNLHVMVRYTLTADSLRIDYEAKTDMNTVINLTNHSYFNLAGQKNESIYDHVIKIKSDKYTVSDNNSIPTGDIASVLNTPLDLSLPTTIGSRIFEDFQPLLTEKGYNFNYILDTDKELKEAAVVIDPKSGRCMKVLTTEPAIQFYTGNYLDGIIGKGQQAYKIHQGLCLETQHYPDSPNHPSFPSTLLKKGHTFHSTTVYKFTTIDKI